MRLAAHPRRWEPGRGPAIATAVILGAVVGAPPGLAARPTYRETTDRYAVHGTRMEQLRAGLTRGPRGFAAYTAWRVDWRYTYAVSPSSCRVSSSTVRVEVRFTYPLWSERARGPAGLRTRWDRFLQRLRVHEAGHRLNGVRAGNEVSSLLAAAISRPTCAALGLAVDARAKTIVQRHARADKTYDARTDHGRTQGAVL